MIFKAHGRDMFKGGVCHNWFVAPFRLLGLHSPSHLPKFGNSYSIHTLLHYRDADEPCKILTPEELQSYRAGSLR